MEIIKINEKEIEVLTSLGELSITQFIGASSIINDESLDNVSKYIKILELTTPLTVDEIEELDIEIFKVLSNLLNLTEITIESTFINEIEIDGNIYKTKSDGTSYKFSVKEMLLLQELVKKNNAKESYILDLVGIIFRESDADGNIIGELTKEAINNRKEVLKSIKMIIILPYLNLLSKYVTG